MKETITKLFILCISFFLATFISHAYGQSPVAMITTESTAEIVPEETTIEILTSPINHSTRSINIRLYATQEETPIKITDENGNIVKAFTLDLLMGWNDINMSIGGLEAGKYAIIYKSDPNEKTVYFVKS